MTEPPAHPIVPSAPQPAARAEPPADRRVESRAPIGAGPRFRCPRCGAPMGRLAADDTPADADAARYCGCCGLVLPSAGARP